MIAGARMMAEGAEVPLDAARQPRIADGKVAGLINGIAHEQLRFIPFIIQRIEPSPVLGPEGGLQIFVFQNDRLFLQRDSPAGIAVLHFIGQDRRTVAQIHAQFSRKFQRGCDIHLSFMVKDRKRVHALQRRSGDRHDLDRDRHIQPPLRSGVSPCFLYFSIPSTLINAEKRTGREALSLVQKLLVKTVSDKDHLGVSFRIIAFGRIGIRDIVDEIRSLAVCGGDDGMAVTADTA